MISQILNNTQKHHSDIMDTSQPSDIFHDIVYTEQPINNNDITYAEDPILVTLAVS